MTDKDQCLEIASTPKTVSGADFSRTDSPAVASLGRRHVLAGSGIAMLGGLLGGARSSAQEWTEVDDWTAVEARNIGVVAEFCAAWGTRDLSNVNATLAENCIYRMSETTPPVHGHSGLADQMQPWIDTSHTIEFEILETHAKGPIVMNHRIDRWMSTTRPVTWEGIGIFFVEDGKIVEWSDYNIRIARS